MRELLVTYKDSGQRLDKYLLKYFNKAPKSFIYKMIRKKNVKLNSGKVKGNEKINEGDLIQLYISDDTIKAFRLEKKVNEVNMTFKTVYEDNNLLICNKPVGLLSQKENKDSTSLVDEVLSYLYKKGDFNPNSDIGFTPSICNRLDRNTSGIVIVGKNIQALQSANMLIREKKISKYYTTVVQGKLKKQIYLSSYITKDKDINKVTITKQPINNESKPIETIFYPIEQKNNFTLVKVNLITGKSHQIRAHLAYLGHPILGDPKYGDKKINNILKEKFMLKHQLLHASSIHFNETDEYLSYLQDKSFYAKEDEIFTRIYNSLDKI